MRDSQYYKYFFQTKFCNFFLFFYLSTQSATRTVWLQPKVIKYKILKTLSRIILFCLPLQDIKISSLFIHFLECFSFPGKEKIGHFWSYTFLQRYMLFQIFLKYFWIEIFHSICSTREKLSKKIHKTTAKSKQTKNKKGNGGGNHFISE